MLLSLEIKDNKAKLFLEFLNSLDFVKINRSELDDEENIHFLNERLAEYEKDPDSAVSARVALQELKAKYGF